VNRAGREGLGLARSQYPGLKGRVYLDSAGAGMPPRRVTDAMKEMVDAWSKEGEDSVGWLEDVIRLRESFGRLIGAGRDEVAVVPNVSTGLVALASSIDFRKRRKVVTSGLNFPTNVILWQRMRASGLVGEVQVLSPDDGKMQMEKWERAIDDETAVVSLDLVGWLSGYREDARAVAELAQRRGALVIVDCFHGAGVFGIDARRMGADALLSGFYKWLCGPHGVACVYVRQDALDSMRPSYTGWMGVKDNVIERMEEGRDVFDLPFRLDSAEPARGAARFEWGTHPSVPVRGAVEAVELALEEGVDRRFRRIECLTRRLREGLMEMGRHVLAPDAGPEQRSGIVSFVEKDHTSLVSRMAREKVVVSGRFGHVRVSPHYYNTEDEVESLLELVARHGKHA
jgi:selenocysteine lyase/cysteine desulfurase